MKRKRYSKREEKGFGDIVFLCPLLKEATDSCRTDPLLYQDREIFTTSSSDVSLARMSL